MPAAIAFSKNSVSDLLRFMEERHRIYLRRREGQPKPWTRDPILRMYKFTNVYRELDAVTVWVREHIRERFPDDPLLWFMLCIARQINWPGTLADLMTAKVWAWPQRRRWDAEALANVLRHRKARGEKVYTGAYMLTCNWPKGWQGFKDKPAFTAHLVLQSVWDRRKEVPFDSLEAFTTWLAQGHGWGTFTAAQVTADLKHTRWLKDAPDWWTWAAPGPGSRRGLNIVCGNGPQYTWRGEQWLKTLQALQEVVNAKWSHEPLCCQDLQNCLCEYSKYTRGSSRTLYEGG